MTTTAEAYGFGARAPYATPRASEYDMKERARLSGLFPRVRNEPMSKQLQVLLKEFEQNAALTGILERRRRLDERTQYELQGRARIDSLAGPPRRPQLRPPPDAAGVMTGGGPGISGAGGSSGSGAPRTPRGRGPSLPANTNRPASSKAS